MVLVLTARYWDFEVDRGPAWLFIRPRPAALETTGADRDDASADGMIALADRVSGLADRISGLADRVSGLADQVWALLEQNFTNRVVLELDEIGTLRSELVEELLALEARIAAADGLMRLCGVTASNEQVLRQFDREARLHAFADRSEAVMGRVNLPKPR